MPYEILVSSARSASRMTSFITFPLPATPVPLPTAPTKCRRRAATPAHSVVKRRSEEVTVTGGVYNESVVEGYFVFYTADKTKKTSLLVLPLSYLKKRAILQMPSKKCYDGRVFGVKVQCCLQFSSEFSRQLPIIMTLICYSTI